MSKDFLLENSISPMATSNPYDNFVQIKEKKMHLLLLKTLYLSKIITEYKNMFKKKILNCHLQESVVSYTSVMART